MKVIGKVSKINPNFLTISKYDLEKNGEKYYREFVEIGEAVCALVYNTKTNKYIFVKQYRPGPNKELVELVGGFPDKALTPVQTVYKEILEETGYLADTIEFIMRLNFVPCYSDEKLNMYYATVSNKFDIGGGLEKDGEFIEIVEMSKKEIQEFDFYNNSDAKTIMALIQIGLLKPIELMNKKPSNVMENPDNREGGC